MSWFSTQSHDMFIAMNTIIIASLCIQLGRRIQSVYLKKHACSLYNYSNSAFQGTKYVIASLNLLLSLNNTLNPFQIHGYLLNRFANYYSPPIPANNQKMLKQCHWLCLLDCARKFSPKYRPYNFILSSKKYQNPYIYIFRTQHRAPSFFVSVLEPRFSSISEAHFTNRGEPESVWDMALQMHVHPCKQWDVITHPYPNFNGGSVDERQNVYE